VLAGLAPVVAVRSALERGWVRNSSGDPAASVPLFAGALARTQGAGLDDLVVDAAPCLARPREPGGG